MKATPASLAPPAPADADVAARAHVVVPGCACDRCFLAGGRVPRSSARWPNARHPWREALFGLKYTPSSRAVVVELDKGSTGG